MCAGEPERQLDEADQRLVGSLRSVLRPEPLPAMLESRILADLERRTAPARRPGLPPVHMLWLAVAACLAVAVLRPPGLAPQPADRLGSVRLSAGEAAEIAAAYGLLNWDSPAEYTLQTVDASLESIERTLRREPGGAVVLPWDREDDWDVPPTADEVGTPQSQGPPKALCLAGRPRGSEG